ncbi:arylsulfatase [Shewanella psychrophila]|nr:arylsulfatase [Shewanella psychrophila]
MSVAFHVADGDYLYAQFPGFYRMASLLEAMAEGIQRGDLEILKGH